MESDRELSALISLLDDEDAEVFEHVRDRIKTYGERVVPILEEAWSDTLNPVLHERLEQLISDIQFEHVAKELTAWVNKEDRKLIDALLIIAKHRYAELNYIEVKRQLDHIHQTVWLEIGPHLTDLEKINVLNQFIYSHFGFTTSYSTKVEERHLFVNHLLESKDGSHISIGLLYLVIARRLELPVYGVRLYHHFVAAYTKAPPEETEEKALRKSVIFYINPMNKGNVFSANEITKYLKTMDTETKDDYFTPCTDYQVVRYYIETLMAFYTKRERFEKVKKMERLLTLL